MRTCACCGEVAADDAETCACCGQASWSSAADEEKPEPPGEEDAPKSERQPEPHRDGGRRRGPR